MIPPSAIPALTSARVMMIRGVERSVPPQASVAVRPDLTVYPSGYTQIVQVGRAVSAAVEFSKVVNKVSDVLAAQGRRVKVAKISFLPT